jgi:hypothetical protein
MRFSVVGNMPREIDRFPYAFDTDEWQDARRAGVSASSGL